MGLVVAGDTDELRDLFANLVVSAMDKQTSDSAHPAFAEIIRQLTPDEARLLRMLRPGNGILLVRTQTIEHPAGSNLTYLTETFVLADGTEQLARPSEQAIYFDDLKRLGLAEVQPPDESRLALRMIDEAREYRHVVSKPDSELKLTDFGVAFWKACVAVPTETE
jgi:hypothetical protein